MILFDIVPVYDMKLITRRVRYMLYYDKLPRSINIIQVDKIVGFKQQKCYSAGYAITQIKVIETAYIYIL